MWNLPSLAVLALAALGGAQDPEPIAPPVPVPVDPNSDDPRYEEVKALDQQFSSAMAGYSLDVHKAKRAGRPEREWPPHPSKAYLPKYSALAEEGSGLAFQWLSQNVHFVEGSPEERRAAAHAIYDRLATEFVSRSYVAQVAQKLPEFLRELGDDYSIQWCARVFDESEIADVQATALETKARLLVRQAGKNKSRVPSEVREIYRILVDGFAGTESAQRASSRLFSRTEADLAFAMNEWLATIREQTAAGGSPDSWPPNPLHEFHNSYLPLAASGYMEAFQWAEVLYPQFAAADRSSRIAGLKLYSEFISLRYLPANTRWMDIKFTILDFLLTHFSDDPVIPELLANFSQESSRFDLSRIEPCFRPHIAPGTPATIRAYSLYVLGQALSKALTQRQLEEGLQLLDTFLSEHADHPAAAEVRIAKARIGRIMPGKLAPDFTTVDENGLNFKLSDYRGRVVILSFGGLWSDAWKAQLPDQCALVAKHADHPFSMIHVNTDTLPRKQVLRKLRRQKVNWRTSMQFSRMGPLLIDWNIESYPTTIVLDAKGTIRARNLPWDEIDALVDELLAGM